MHVFFLCNVLHHSLLILIARNVPQHLSTTLRGHFKQQNNRQEAQKCEKHGTKYTVRSLVYSVRTENQEAEGRLVQPHLGTRIGPPQLPALHVSANGRRSIMNTDLGAANTFSCIQKMRLNYILTCIRWYRFVFINTTTVAFFTSHEHNKTKYFKMIFVIH